MATLPPSPPQAGWFDPGATVEIMRVGTEGEPVLVIDTASGAADRLVDIAADHTRFAPAATVGSFYPGLLAPAPVDYLNAMVQFALPLIAAHFDTGPVVPARARGNFSLVTTPSEALSPDQRMPHVDTADRLQFAAVHYLCRDNRDGTGFFRHRATGFETIDAARLPAYRTALDVEMLGPIPPGYRTGSDALFDLVGAVAGRFDRLILYRAALLHSGLIAQIPSDSENPRAGRLTGNLFLQCRTRS